MNVSKQHSSKPAQKQDMSAVLIGAMALVVLVIVGLFIYSMILPTPHTRTFANLSGDVHLRATNITVDPFVKPDVWAFRDAYIAMRHLDKKYETAGADFHNENLRHGPMIHPNAVDDYLHDLDLLEAWIGNNTFKNQSKAIEHLLLGRRKMLLSERSFQQALSYGKHGTFNRDVNCEDRDIIKVATKLYNESQIQGWRAMAELDKALSSYPTSRDFIGVNTGFQEMRPKFYDNIFLDISYVAQNNLVAIEKYCEGTVADKEMPQIAEGNLSRSINAVRGMAS